MLLAVLASTGIRVAEAARMCAEDIVWDAGTIRIYGKGGKQREVAPQPSVLWMLHRFLGQHVGPIWLSLRHGRPLTPHQLQKVICALGAKAGIPAVHPHRLRARFATRFLDEFSDIHALQKRTGHEKIETTARYVYYRENERGLQLMREMVLPFEV